MIAADDSRKALIYLVISFLSFAGVIILLLPNFSMIVAIFIYAILVTCLFYGFLLKETQSFSDLIGEGEVHMPSAFMLSAVLFLHLAVAFSGVHGEVLGLHGTLLSDRLNEGVPSEVSLKEIFGGTYLTLFLFLGVVCAILALCLNFLLLRDFSKEQKILALKGLVSKKTYGNIMHLLSRR